MAVPAHPDPRRRLLLGALAGGWLAGLGTAGSGVAWAQAAPRRYRRVASAADADASAGADAPTDTQSDDAFVVAAGEAVRIERFSVYGRSFATMEVPRVIRSDTEWRVRLSSLAYRVTRQGASEPAFSGRYLHNHAAGLYRCVCCNTALFDSRSRFNTAGGWLTFHAPISRFNVVESLPGDADTSGDIHHLAVSCRRCDAHVGEVFDDGPPPTDLRYRIDSVALDFVAYPPY